MTNNLTVEDVSRISLGYIWEPEMSYEEFCEKNPNLDFRNAPEIWEKIELRYIDFKFEKV